MSSRATLAISSRSASELTVQDRATVYTAKQEVLELIKEGKFTPEITTISHVDELSENDVESLQDYLKKQMAIRRAEISKGVVVEDSDESDYSD
jgi:GTPase Era involved in 16S rRNA processing